jgi:hypothetical protein
VRTTLAASLDPNSVSPGLLGFIVVCIIGVCVWFLGRSMSRQLRKLDAGADVMESAPLAAEDHMPSQSAIAGPNV